MSLPEAVAPPSPARVVGGALLLGTAYAVAGRLGLLLALPPGYATAVWPPTGIALAGALILGPRAGWDVWLGSFLVNLWVTWSGGQLTWSTAFMSATIALGAVAGALVALRSLRADPHWSTSLERQRDILRFLFLGSAAMAGVVGWDLDPATGRVQWTSDTGSLFGMDPGAMPGLPSALPWCGRINASASASPWTGRRAGARPSSRMWRSISRTGAFAG